MQNNHLSAVDKSTGKFSQTNWEGNLNRDYVLFISPFHQAMAVLDSLSELSMEELMEGIG